MHFPPAPRRVPLSLRILTTLGPGSQIGWAILGFGSIFFWAFAGQAEIPFSFRGPLTLVQGRVTNVEQTNASVNKRRVMAVHYRYSVMDQRFEGVSYDSGTSLGSGDTAVVEYRNADPAQSRIEGMRRRIFPSGTLFVALLPLAALIVIVVAMKLGAKRARLLQHGVLAEGKLTSQRPTNMRVNRRTVYELTFQFTAYDGSMREVKARTSMTERLTDEKLEPLLYSPTDPQLAYMLDEVPARPQVNEVGELQGRPLAALGALVLPTLVILGNLWAAS